MSKQVGRVYNPATADLGKSTDMSKNFVDELTAFDDMSGITGNSAGLTITPEAAAVCKAVLACEWSRPTDSSMVLSFLQNDPAMKQLLDTQINDLMETPSFSTTLLYTAARVDNRPVVDYLLNRPGPQKCDPNRTYPEMRRNTALHVSCFRLQVDVVRMLSANGALPSVLNDDGETALGQLSNPDAAETEQIRGILLGGHVAAAAADASEAAIKGVMDVINQMGTAEGIAMNALQSQLQLFLTSFKAQISTAHTIMLPDGSSLETTLLYTACRAGGETAVNLLVDAGADPNVHMQSRETPLHVAAYRGYINIVRRLVSAGADKNAQNARAELPGSVFMPSVPAQVKQEIKIACGRDDAAAGHVSVAGSMNASAFSEAVSPAVESGAALDKMVFECANSQSGGAPGIVQDYFKNHPDAATKGFGEFNSPLLYTAARSGNEDMVRLCLDNGADVMWKTGGGDTSLHVACYRCNLGVVRLLLARGADPDAKKNDGTVADQFFSQQVQDANLKNTIRQEVAQVRQQRLAQGEQGVIAKYVSTLSTRKPPPGYPEAATRAAQVPQNLPPNPQQSHLMQMVVQPVIAAMITDIFRRDFGNPTDPVSRETMASTVPKVLPDVMARANQAGLGSVPDGMILPLDAGAIEAIVVATAAVVFGQVAQQAAAWIGIAADPLSGNALSNIANDAKALGARLRKTFVDSLANKVRGLTDAPFSSEYATTVLSPQLERNFDNAPAVPNAVLSHMYRETNVPMMLARAGCTIPNLTPSPQAFVDGKLAQLSTIAGISQSMQAMKHELAQVTAKQQQQPAGKNAAMYGSFNYQLLVAADSALHNFARASVFERTQHLFFVGAGVPDNTATAAAIAGAVQAQLANTAVQKINTWEHVPEADLRQAALAAAKSTAGQLAAPAGSTPSSTSEFDRFKQELLNGFNPNVNASPAFEQALASFVRRIQLHRQFAAMPMYAKCREVRDRLNTCDVILIKADTGSGKSVCLPQYLCDAHNYGTRIIVTQPRREPVLSISRHVTNMFGAQHVSGLVAGAKEGGDPKRTMLHYATDGLILSNFETENPDVPTIVVIDEVHERNSNMDQLLLVLLARIKAGIKNVTKIILASATVEVKWFEDTVRAASTLSGPPLRFVAFEDVSVKCVHKVTEKAPAGGYVTWTPPSAANPKNNHPQQAAQEAATIVRADAKNKVLVFLASPAEVEMADNEFAQLCPSVSHAPIHAKVAGIQTKLLHSRVVFANSIAETSLTIPNLTHVVDFNTTNTVRALREDNISEIGVTLSSRSSAKQRRGRVGRTMDGTYISMHDPSQLRDDSILGFDTMSNEHLLMHDFRLRVFTDFTLFKSDSKGRKTLGVGVDPIPNVDPNKFATEVQLVSAHLCMIPSIAVGLVHALKKRTCPLAIVWLSAMFECREPPMAGKKPLPVSLKGTGFGQYGDHGVLLEILAAFYKWRNVDPYTASATPVDATALEAWCKQNDDINHWFLMQVDSRLHVLMRKLDDLASKGHFDALSAARQKTHPNWKWEDIKEALLMGNWRNTSMRVTKSLSHDVIGPFMSMDNTQVARVGVLGSSAWFQQASNMPDFVMYHDALVQMRGRTNMAIMMEVDVDSLARLSKAGPDITQSLTLTEYEYDCIDYHDSSLLQGNSNYMTPNHGGVKLNVDTSGTYSDRIMRRLNGKTPASLKLKAEITIKGKIVPVAFAIRQFAEAIEAALQYMKTCPPTSTATIQLFDFMSKNVPPRPLSRNALAQIDGGMAARLDKICRNRPNDAALRAELQSSNKQDRICALCHVLVKEFHCTIKGGAIRDLVVLGKEPNDVDMALPKALPGGKDVTQSNFASECAVIHKRLVALGVKATAIHGRKWPPNASGNADFMLLNNVTLGPDDIECEYVPPYNNVIWPQKTVDATMNNLQMTHADLVAQQISQIVAIGTSAERIVRQIIKKETSPVYDIRWVEVPSGKTPEGVNNNVFCEAIPGCTTGMGFRLYKMRTKGYKLVEGPSFSGGKIVLYHGTSQSVQQIIIQSQTFKSGSAGLLGPGVYLSRDLTICKMFGSYFLRCEVMPGKVKAMPGWDSAQKWANDGEFQTAFLEQSKSPRTPPLEEWCITPDALRLKLATITNIVAHP